MSASELLPIQMTGRDYCPCESGKRVEKCGCAVGAEFRPRSVPVTPPGAQTGYAHPGCYLRGDNDCSTKLSREHFLSESILEVIEVANGELMVSGFPWLKAPRPLSPGAVASRVLCVRHNQALSPLDSIALRFYQRLSAAPEHLCRPRGRADKVYLFSGPDLERWMLKALCGLLASGNAMTADGKRVDFDPPRDWLDVLMGRRHLPPELGMYVTSRVGDQVHLSHLIGFGPSIGDNGAPIGAVAEIHGIGFALVLARVLRPVGTVLDGAVYRPRDITLNSGSARVTLWIAGNGWRETSGVQIAWSPPS